MEQTQKTKVAHTEVDDAKLVSMSFALVILILNFTAFLFRIIPAYFCYEDPTVLSVRVLLRVSVLSVLPAICASVCLLLKNSSGIRMRFVPLIIAGFLAPVSLVSLLFADVYGLPFGSQTQDSFNYSKANEGYFSSYQLDYFPEEIPMSATDVKYMYRYSIGFDRFGEICLRVSLSNTDYDTERARIQAQFPDATVIKRSNGITIYQFDMCGNPNGNYYKPELSWFYSIRPESRLPSSPYGAHS